MNWKWWITPLDGRPFDVPKIGRAELRTLAVWGSIVGIVAVWIATGFDPITIIVGTSAVIFLFLPWISLGCLVVLALVALCRLAGVAK